ncbi:MAG: NfeD family protein [Proteobacteria bacterium]|nr:NfeD family protein [Pseudomonadota bacterium]MCH8220741.1 NfeD family protein [Pseudomonadota bacterium]
MMWWGWIVLGVIILGAEMFVIDAQFFLVFIGLSAILVGLLNLFGLALPEWGQWMLFAALALISMFTFRKALYSKIKGSAPGFRASIEGDMVLVANELAPGAESRTSHRGTNWTIRNIGGGSIPAGQKARVVKTEGLVLHVSNDPAD